MQREFEMVVQTSAATQSLRYLLKSGDMTCITKGEITKRLVKMGQEQMSRSSYNNK